MAEIPNQKSIFGLVLLLLLLGGQSGGLGIPGGSGKSGITGGIPGLGNLSALGKKLKLENFARDMHRMVDMMDHMESLTQMAGVGQIASALTAAASQPASGSHIGGAANSVSGALADSLGSLNSQDLSQLMEMAGPIMNMLNNQNGGYRK